MATLALGLVGGAIGSSIGGTIAGITAAAIGQAIGAAVGSYIDAAIFAPKTPDIIGQTLDRINVNNASEGVAINRLYGTYRLTGNLIWATNFTAITKKESLGGKGIPFGGGGSRISEEYTVSFAIGLCEGIDNAKLKRVFADGQEIDTSRYTVRFYEGSETQVADSKIAAVEGTDLAFRGLCYLVFEDLNLTEFGNRVPNITAEIYAPVTDSPLPETVEAVSFGHGYGEVAYGTTISSSDDLVGNSGNLNNYAGKDSSDFVVSIDSMTDTLPNATKINLSAAWFGDDLRCGECLIKPRVETNARFTRPVNWTSAGMMRDTTIFPGDRILTDATGLPDVTGEESDGYATITFEGNSYFLDERGFKTLKLLDDDVFITVYVESFQYLGSGGDGPSTGAGGPAGDSGSDSGGGQDGGGEQ